MKKNDFVTALREKATLGDQLEDNLRKIIEKIRQLQEIEYPGENEREMLVSEEALCPM